MIIREASRADSKWILHHRMGMFEAMGESKEFLQETEELTEDYVNGDWTKDYRYFLVEEEGNVIGGCGLSTFRIPPKALQTTGVYGYLSNMFIEPEYRRQGLGHSLLRHIIEYCRQEGIGLLLLHASKEGFLLYQTMHFENNPGLMQILTSKWEQ